MPVVSSRLATALAALIAMQGIAPSPLPAQTGRIVGRVEVSRALTARRPQFRLYGDPGRPAPRALSPEEELQAELRNVVVYLDAAGEGLPRPEDTSRAAVMAQANERFDPRVVPVLQGTRVEFPNYDDIYHNVFSLSSARTFDLGRYPKGTSRSVSFPTRGVVQVFCHIHADMSGVVLVLPTTFFASPATSGEFVLEKVPPGEYTIVGWHERTRPSTQRVRVVAGQTATVNFKLPLTGEP